jgi:hypothetical protein
MAAARTIAANNVVTSPSGSLETIFHHVRFTALTNEPAGWTSQFRETILSIAAGLHDFRGGEPVFLPALQS